ncbi:MAG: VacB/RNase II family 3'-5' exoribonuclease [Planctomycetes bacterium]|nr:VacB/RNase II family 3'-5' exoribonuclease [Planctomycetota bacterium]
MSLRFRHRILEHLSHSHYRPSSPKSIVRDMRVNQDDRGEFNATIAELVKEGGITVIDDLVRLPSYDDEVIGILRLNPRGFGFVVPDQPYREGDLFVPRGSTRDAISGDRVRARVVRQAWRAKAKPGRSPFTGKIIEVIERGRDHFVGTLIKQGRNWYVEPDGKSLYKKVVIRDPHAKNAKHGDKVVIELLHYPEDDYVAEGVITEVLGEAGRPDVETQAVIVAHGLRTDFPDEAVQQARVVSRNFEDEATGPWPEREDLTENFIFTIDPPDARDFDDAISIDYDEELEEWTLGVHIADVAYFIPPGSPLDVESEERGNSVYLPRLVIPMLPEVLSNGVCSLQEGVPRFTKSAFISFDKKGRVIGQRACRSVISSAKRLTYLEAQALIDGDKKEARKQAKTEPVYTDELIDALKRSYQLAKILEKRRLRDGMIVLNLPEVVLVFDDDGHVIDAVPEDDAYTHKIIEMFMVEANEALARLFDDLNIPILRRIHPDPAHGDMTELRMYAMVAHYNLPDEPTRHDLQRLLEATKDTPASRAIHFAVLRTLTKATYSPASIGHYALGSEHYAHFTSPIRRYPDLTLHRAIEAYLDATDNGRTNPGGRKRRELTLRLVDDPRVPDEGKLISLGHHCSETEVEATAAERELRDFLVMQFLKEHHLGDEFPGVVTGVIGGGVFVSIERYLVEGMVRTQDLPQSQGRPDHWRVNESTGRLVANRSGATVGIGDIVTVKIVQVDLASRHLDLMMMQLPERTSMEHPKKASKPRSLQKVKPGGPGRRNGKSKPKNKRKRKSS